MTQTTKHRPSQQRTLRKTPDVFLKRAGAALRRNPNIEQVFLIERSAKTSLKKNVVVHICRRGESNTQRMRMVHSSLKLDISSYELEQFLMCLVNYHTAFLLVESVDFTEMMLLGGPLITKGDILAVTEMAFGTRAKAIIQKSNTRRPAPSASLGYLNSWRNLKPQQHVISWILMFAFIFGYLQSGIEKSGASEGLPKLNVSYSSPPAAAISEKKITTPLLPKNLPPASQEFILQNVEPEEPVQSDELPSRPEPVDEQVYADDEEQVIDNKDFPEEEKSIEDPGFYDEPIEGTN